MNPPKNGPAALAENSSGLKSRMGAFFLGSHVIFRGQDLHKDLKDIDWLELYAFGITGRRFSPEKIRLIHAFWTITSYPDVRLWNNRVAALVGSVRSTPALSQAAAIAIAEAHIYGGGPVAQALDFLVQTKERIAKGEPLDMCVRKELKMHRRLGGYGRPMKNGDERIQHLMEIARSAGLADGPYVKLAFAIDKTMVNERLRMRMNYAALICALSLDIGFTPAESRLLMVPIFLAGVPPGYIEALERPEGTLFATPCNNIIYSGQPARSWRSSNVRSER